MAERVSFSSEEQSLVDVAIHHQDVQAGLYEFFASDSQTLHDRYTGAKIDEAREKALNELNLTSSLSVLSAIEADIRVDYLSRVYGRWRDSLSRSMKALHKERENAARLEDDLIRLWRDETPVPKLLLNELIGAFKYRHWLAHGRYWTPKLGRRYDYETVFEIAEEFVEAKRQYNESC